MRIGSAVIVGIALAAIAALARAGDGRSVEERLATLEGQVARLTSTVTAQNTRIAQLEGAGTKPATGSSSTPVPLVPTTPPPSTPPAMADSPPTSTPKAPEPESRTVYGTKTGTKYHGAGCSYLRGSAIPMSLSDAIARGLTPCSRCGGR